MTACTRCGSPIEPGSRFCGGCGRPVASAPPVPLPPPPSPAATAPGFPPPPAPAFAPSPSGLPPLPQTAAAAGTPPAAAAAPPAPHLKPLGRRAASHGTIFEVFEYDMFRLARIVLEGASVVLEAGQLHYWLGDIQMQVQTPSLGGMAKSLLTKEKAVRPVYSGTGEIWLEPTFGEIEILELGGNEVWILDRGSYLASDISVQLDVYSNPVFTSIFGGEGMFQTQVSGTGKVFYWTPGPVQRIELRGQTLTVDGSFAVARTASLHYSVEKASRGLFRSMISGEGIVNVFRGYGSVMLAPVPNRNVTLIREFQGLHHAIRSISKG